MFNISGRGSGCLTYLGGGGVSNISGGGGDIPFPQANSPAICSCLPCLICFFAGEKG
jgi:hypothetical protein